MKYGIGIGLSLVLQDTTSDGKEKPIISVHYIRYTKMGKSICRVTGEEDLINELNNYSSDNEFDVISGNGFYQVRRL